MRGKNKMQKIDNIIICAIVTKMSKDIVFEQIQPFADISFWQEYSHLKLNKLKLDDKPLDIFGTYTVPMSKSAKGAVLAITESALPDTAVSTLGGVVEAKVPGLLHNVNTLEQFVQSPRKEIAGSFPRVNAL